MGLFSNDLAFPMHLGHVGSPDRIDRGDLPATDQSRLTRDERAELIRLRKESHELTRKILSGWLKPTLPGSCSR